MKDEKNELFTDTVVAAKTVLDTGKQVTDETTDNMAIELSTSAVDSKAPVEIPAQSNALFSTDESTPAQAEENSQPEINNDASSEAPCQQLEISLDSGIQQILAAIKELQASFDGKLRYDAKKDGIIDRQFQELSEFRSGLVEKVTMQIINDLIREIDSAQKLIKFYESVECNETNFKKLQKVLHDIPASLCDVLEKYGVTSYSSEVGAPFNPKLQRALKTTETGDVTKDKKVRELLRLGFEQELEARDNQPAKKKILRSEMVDVFVFNPALTEPLNTGNPQETHSAANTATAVISTHETEH